MNNGFPHGHETLKVTVTYEGHPASIDGALHGAVRETEMLRAELDEADGIIDTLSQVVTGLSNELTELEDKAADLGCELAACREENERAWKAENDAWKARDTERDQKWVAEDAKYHAQEALRQANIYREADNRNFTAQIAKLKAALNAATGGEVQVQDVLDFLASRESAKANFDVNAPKQNHNFYRAKGTDQVVEDDPTYPFGLLVGDRENVKAQILACFVDDPQRQGKIQAIKTLRNRSGLGLKEAKDSIEWALGTSYKDR